MKTFNKLSTKEQIALFKKSELNFNLDLLLRLYKSVLYNIDDAELLDIINSLLVTHFDSVHDLTFNTPKQNETAC